MKRRLGDRGGGGGGGGGGVVGGVGVVCGDGVDRGVGGVDCGVICKALISPMISKVPEKDNGCGTRASSDVIVDRGGGEDIKGEERVMREKEGEDYEKIDIRL
ncbi:hypothetical protein Tco_0467601 [Tanacetum coccineum]